jgi:hypothetical protein
MQACAKVSIHVRPHAIEIGWVHAPMLTNETRVKPTQRLIAGRIPIVEQRET